MQPQDILDALNRRYAVRKYDTNKKVDEATLNVIIEAGRLAPSSANSQPWKFVVVSSEAMKEKLAVHSGNPQVKECSHLIVLCATTAYDDAFVDAQVALTAEVRWVSVESIERYKWLLTSQMATSDHWVKHQPFIALGSMILAAAELKVDASPMGGFHHQGFDDVLGLHEQHLTSVVLLAVGYRSDEDVTASAVKVRRPAEKVVIRM